VSPPLPPATAPLAAGLAKRSRVAEPRASLDSRAVAMSGRRLSEAAPLGALSRVQAKALEQVEALGRANLPAAYRQLADRLGHERLPQLEAIGTYLRDQAPLTWNFDPQRRLPDGRTVLDALLDEPRLKNAWETGVSGGSLEHEGAKRDATERRLFAGAYHAEGASKAERPLYCALSLGKWPEGAAPTYGGCYFELSPEVKARASFTPTDSFQCSKGVLYSRDTLEGAVCWALDPETFDELAQLARGERTVMDERLYAPGYVEAQIHGPLALDRDAARLVIDPALRGAEVEAKLLQLASRLGVDVAYADGL
jgi:hypothetical protein